MKTDELTEINIKILPEHLHPNEEDGERPGDDVPEGGRSEDDDDDGVKGGGSGTRSHFLTKGKSININIML